MSNERSLFEIRVVGASSKIEQLADLVIQSLEEKGVTVHHRSEPYQYKNRHKPKNPTSLISIMFREPQGDSDDSP
jgi:hypothetical protein